MGLLTDTFTGDPLKQSAQDARNYLGTAQNNLALGTGTAANAASSYLKDAYGNARGDLGQGYDAATGVIRGSSGQAQDYLAGGANSAIGTLQAGGGAYQPLSDLAARYGQGAGMYANSLGLNGPQGNQAAQQAFQAGPGYEWQLNQGIDALNRRANAGGMLQGGNANSRAIEYATGLANKEYGGWQDRLAGFNQLELGATQGAAAGNQGNNLAVAGLQSGLGQNQASVAGGEGRSIADLARQYYGGLGQLDVGGGTAQANNITDANKTIVGIGTNFANPIANTYKQEGDAAMTGSANTIGLLKNLATAGAGAFGGGAFGGGGGGNAFLPSSSFLNNSWGY